MRRFVLLLPLALAMCGEEEEPVFAPLRYNYLPPIPLNVASIDAARQAGAATLNIGLFINAIIQFIIVAFAIFWMVKLLAKLHLAAHKAPPPGPTPTEVLLTEIRDLLKARPATTGDAEIVTQSTQI